MLDVTINTFSAQYLKLIRTKTNKMKHILTLISLLTISLIGRAQSPDYTDLRILYADANYEKLAKEAEKYTNDDKTKKDILPYIWLSKGLYKISLSGTDDEKFKNAYKDAIKFLGKGIKYDLKYNDGATIEEEREFIDQFQMSLYELIINEIGAESYKRGSAWAIKYQKISVNTVGSSYIMGACKFFDNDKQGAREKWQEGEKLLEEIESIENWSDADKNMLKMGVLYSAKAMIKGRQESKAQDLLGKVSQWFENDEDWQTQYDEIVNGI